MYFKSMQTVILFFVDESTKTQASSPDSLIVSKFMCVEKTGEPGDEATKTCFTVFHTGGIFPLKQLVGGKFKILVKL